MEHSRTAARSWIAACVAAVVALVIPLAAGAQGQPMIEHIEPTSGPPGTRVQIIGRFFRSNLRVLFNDAQLAPQERLPERVTVVVPPNAQSGRFVIAHGSDEVESEVFRVTAADPPPRVSAIEPAASAPGGEVVLRGENFAARLTDNQVRIGNLPMVVRSGDPTALRVIVPDGASSGPITVRTPGGEVQSPPLAIGARVLVRDFTPTAAAPGGHVVIHGAGFATAPAANRVTIGGQPARVLRASASELEVEVARDAQRGGAIAVEVQGGGRFETGASLTVAPAALITAVEPAQAAPGGQVTLRGQRFGTNTAAVQVTLGTSAARVVSVGPEALVVQVPAGAGTGRWNVTVGGIGPVQSPADFTVLEPVSVTGFSPRAADAGDRVTLSGTGFSTTATSNSVRLGALQARVVSATAHELVVEVPAQARSGIWYVAVTGNAEAHSREPFMVTLRPRITALDPDRGVAGARVTLRGTNFPTDRPLVQVRLGDLECNVISSAPDAIVVEVPRSVQPGPARFSVIVRLQGTGRAEMEFFVLVPTRITAVEPAAAPVGARVTIRGEGFETDPHQLRLRVGTQLVRPASATTSAIEFVVPRGAQSGQLVVEAPMRQTASAAFTVQVAPVVQSFAPAQGAPGARVTLRGRNFGTEASAVSVTLGDAPMTVSQVTPTAIVVEVPAGAQTGRITVRVNGQGEAAAPRDFRITTSRPTAAP